VHGGSPHSHATHGAYGQAAGLGIGAGTGMGAGAGAGFGATGCGVGPGFGEGSGTHASMGMDGLDMMGLMGMKILHAMNGVNVGALPTSPLEHHANAKEFSPTTNFNPLNTTRDKSSDSLKELSRSFRESVTVQQGLTPTSARLVKAKGYHEDGKNLNWWKAVDGERFVWEVYHRNVKSDITRKREIQGGLVRAYATAGTSCPAEVFALNAFWVRYDSAWEGLGDLIAHKYLPGIKLEKVDAIHTRAWEWKEVKTFLQHLWLKLGNVRDDLIELCMTTRWWSALRLLERTVADPSVVEKESGLTEHLSTSASCEENDQLADLRRTVDLLVEQQTCMQPVLSGGLRNGGKVCGGKHLTENHWRWEIKRQMKTGRGKE
jgi:hypothetical protein